jgi:hypothetical protein
MMYAIAHGVVTVVSCTPPRNFGGDRLFRCGGEQLWNARGIVCDIETDVAGTQEGPIRNYRLECCVDPSLRLESRCWTTGR